MKENFKPAEVNHVKCLSLIWYNSLGFNYKYFLLLFPFELVQLVEQLYTSKLQFPVLYSFSQPQSNSINYSKNTPHFLISVNLLLNFDI